jgi:hypothetical protein
MKYNVLGVLLIVLMLSLSATAQKGNKPASGTITGVIQRTESDGNGLWSVWMKVRGTTYELTVANVRVVGGSKSDLKKGISIRAAYRNLALSEQDYFYYGEARTITILKPRGK